MLKRELIKIGICTAIGVVVGLLMERAELIPIFALYLIGVVYSAKIFLPKLWEVLTLGTRAQINALMVKGCLVKLLILILSLLAICIILAVAWVVGIVMAVVAICRAVAQDRLIDGDDKASPRPREANRPKLPSPFQGKKRTASDDSWNPAASSGGDPWGAGSSDSGSDPWAAGSSSDSDPWGASSSSGSSDSWGSDSSKSSDWDSGW